jgi:hypothetical protein
MSAARELKKMRTEGSTSVAPCSCGELVTIVKSGWVEGCTGRTTKEIKGAERINWEEIQYKGEAGAVQNTYGSHDDGLSCSHKTHIGYPTTNIVQDIFILLLNGICLCW